MSCRGDAKVSAGVDRTFAPRARHHCDGVAVSSLQICALLSALLLTFTFFIFKWYSYWLMGRNVLFRARPTTVTSRIGQWSAQ